jgi:hypothetical protein
MERLLYRNRQRVPGLLLLAWSTRAPGNRFAEAEKCQDKNEQRDDQESDEFHPLARTAASCPFGGR